MLGKCYVLNNFVHLDELTLLNLTEITLPKNFSPAIKISDRLYIRGVAQPG